MKKIFVLTVIVLMVMSTLLAAGSVSTANADESKVLEFNTMIGVPRPYTGPTNMIRGVPGGGLPWVVDSAFGKLKPDGALRVTVKGLVLDPNDPDVIATGRGGTNPIANFKAIVSCLSRDAAGSPTTVNVSTGLFPASASGDSQIEETLSIPSPCIAPIIFVTSATGSWFAATGF